MSQVIRKFEDGGKNTPDLYSSGENKWDKNKLIQNLQNNAQTYLDKYKISGKLADKFRNSLNSIIEGIKDGSIVKNSDGTLTDTHGKLASNGKLDKNIFGIKDTDNNGIGLSTHYFNQIISGMNTYTPPEKTAFDFNKILSTDLSDAFHGSDDAYTNWWTNASQLDRAKKLEDIFKSWLPKVHDWFDTYDMKGAKWNTEEELKSAIQNLINMHSINKGVATKDFLGAANQAGLSLDNMFPTTAVTPTTAAEAAKVAAAKAVAAKAATVPPVPDEEKAYQDFLAKHKKEIDKGPDQRDLGSWWDLTKGAGGRRVLDGGTWWKSEGRKKAIGTYLTRNFINPMFTYPYFDDKHQSFNHEGLAKRWLVMRSVLDNLNNPKVIVKLSNNGYAILPTLDPSSHTIYTVHLGNDINADPQAGGFYVENAYAYPELHSYLKSFKSGGKVEKYQQGDSIVTDTARIQTTNPTLSQGAIDFNKDNSFSKEDSIINGLGIYTKKYIDEHGTPTQKRLAHFNDVGIDNNIPQEDVHNQDFAYSHPILDEVTNLTSLADIFGAFSKLAPVTVGTSSINTLAQGVRDWTRYGEGTETLGSALKNTGLNVGITALGAFPGLSLLTKFFTKGAKPAKFGLTNIARNVLKLGIPATAGVTAAADIKGRDNSINDLWKLFFYGNANAEQRHNAYKTLEDLAMVLNSSRMLHGGKNFNKRVENRQSFDVGEKGLIEGNIKEARENYANKIRRGEIEGAYERDGKFYLPDGKSIPVEEALGKGNYMLSPELKPTNPLDGYLPEDVQNAQKFYSYHLQNRFPKMSNKVAQTINDLRIRRTDFFNTTKWANKGLRNYFEYTLPNHSIPNIFESKYTNPSIYKTDVGTTTRKALAEQQAKLQAEKEAKTAAEQASKKEAQEVAESSIDKAALQKELKESKVALTKSGITDAQIEDYMNNSNEGIYSDDVKNAFHRYTKAALNASKAGITGAILSAMNNNKATAANKYGNSNIGTSYSGSDLHGNSIKAPDYTIGFARENITNSTPFADADKIRKRESILTQLRGTQEGIAFNTATNGLYKALHYDADKMMSYIKNGIPENDPLAKNPDIIKFNTARTLYLDKVRALGLDPNTFFNNVIKTQKNYNGGILNERISELFRKGGIFKYAGGSAIKDITGIPHANNDNSYWKSDVYYKFKNALADWLVKTGNYQQINDMQKKHYGLWTKWVGSKNFNRAYLDPDVGSYQDLIKSPFDFVNTLGIQNAWNLKRYPGATDNRTSKDSPTGNWTTDKAYSGITDDRRLLGREGDFSKQEEEDEKKFWNTKGYEFYLDPTTKYYMLKLLNGAATGPGSENPNLGSIARPAQKNPSPLSGIKVNPADAIALGRALYGAYANTKYSNEYAARLQPTLLDPVRYYTPVTGNYLAKKEAEDQAEQLQYNASIPTTSNASLQKASVLDAAKKAADLQMKGQTADATRYYQTLEASNTMENKNKEIANEIANKNITAIGATRDARNLIDYRTHMSNVNNIYLPYLASREGANRDKEALQKNLAYKIAMATKAEEYNNGVIQDITNKFNRKEITEDQKNALLKAAQSKASRDMLELQRQIYGSSSMYYQVPQDNTFPNYVLTSKKGGSLDFETTKDFNKNQVRYAEHTNNSINRRTDLYLKLDGKAAEGIFTLIKKGLQLK